MTVLTVNINDKKDKKALKALKAFVEALDLNYDVETNEGKKNVESISIPVSEWNKIQKRLNTEVLYEEFAKSITYIKDDIDGKITLKNARELLNGN